MFGFETLGLKPTKARPRVNRDHVDDVFAGDGVSDRTDVEGDIIDQIDATLELLALAMQESLAKNQLPGN